MKPIIAGIQFNPTVGDVQSNLSKIGLFVANAVKMGAEFIVLPEICDIGYDLKAIKRLAQPFPNPSTEEISKFAAMHGIVIIAGLAEREDDKIFNSAVVFDKNGNVRAKYRKVHLCVIPPIDEEKVFTPGSEIFVTEVSGIKVGLSICYDIRFPELYRKLASGGAQIIVLPTAFPRMRIEQLEICLRARAIENQLFLISANHCGNAAGVELGGRSMIVGPEGQILAKASDNKAEIVLAQIDLDEISKTRTEKPVFPCRRPELY